MIVLLFRVGSSQGQLTTGYRRESVGPTDESVGRKTRGDHDDYSIIEKKVPLAMRVRESWSAM